MKSSSLVVSVMVIGLSILGCKREGSVPVEEEGSVPDAEVSQPAGEGVAEGEKGTVPVVEEGTVPDAADEKGPVPVADEAKGNEGPVVVRIDGVDLTKKEVCRRARSMLTLRLNKQRKTTVDKKEWGFLNSYCQSAVDRELSRVAVRKYLDEHQVTASSNLVKTITRRFERTFGVHSKKLKRWHRVDDLKFMLGKHGDQVDRELQDWINYAAMTNALLTASPVTVSEADIDGRLQSIADYNTTATATNALIFARATNVWQEVVAKTISFEDAAKKYSEDMYIAEGCEWGMFTRDQLEDEKAVKALLPTLKIGDITPPVESDGGLAILRLDPSDEEKNITLSRIFFRLPMYFNEETREEAARTIREEKEREAINEQLKALIQTLKVEYPDGQNLFGTPAKMTNEDFQSCYK